MEEGKYTFGDKSYSREELLEFGKRHYPKFYWIFRGTGIGLFFIGFCISLFAIPFIAAGEPYFWIYFVVAAPFLIPGIVLFIISFKKQPDEAYIKHATDYFSKQAARKAQREDRVSYKKENRDIDQILKYKELLDKGIITQEEFDAKKKELF